MKNMIRFLPVVGGAIAGAVVALAIAGGGSTSHSTTTVVQPATAGLPTTLHSPSGLSINQIYRKDSPGVVDITVSTVQSTGGGFPFGYQGQQQATAEGSGVVYDTSGDILTDEHVVANATSVTVALQDGKRYKARVLGTDASTDVGVIKVDAPASELHPISLADSSKAQVGDPVVAIGSPFSLPETTTQGIVSATGRPITAPNGYTIPGAIQTDAAINPGNSGGPLLDANGDVLGLSDQIETNNTTVTGQGSSSGVGFAVPSNTVRQIAAAIINGHPVKHPYVGVSLQSSSTGGAGVEQVQTGSPAAVAGLRVGDLITAVNGQPITGTEGFISTVDTYSPGQTVTLTVRRGASTQQIRVKLGTRPASTPQAG